MKNTQVHSHYDFTCLTILAWDAEFQEANTSLVDREERIRACYKKIEQELTLLGATAIEDRLQRQVPETIQLLRRAGIKIWMLTGDKRATAVQIGISCNLVLPEPWGVHLHLDSQNQTAEDLKRTIDEYYGRAISFLSFDSSPTDRRHSHSSAPSKQVTIIVDGHTLRQIFENNESTKSFVELGLVCHSVICCRVSPRQKSLVVNLIKERKFTTLAIGDGGNDVAMIQRAQVGVGIKGREGLQASRAADYSIAQFRYLRRLLLVHGRNAYRRTAFTALYCFYKSIFLCLIQAIYVIFCGNTCCFVFADLMV
jgi:phospholipid-translocating ATPase